MKKLRTGVLAFLFPILNGYAQSPSTNIRPLTIGDTMPDIQFVNVINSPISTLRLSEMKSKLIILDFWATSCASCLKAFPSLDSLQDMFRNDLRILLINPTKSGDDLKKVERTLEKAAVRLGKPIDLPVAVGDSIAFDLFQFKYVPRYVWVDDQRIIRAVTNKAGITVANIKAFMDGTMPTLPIKNDE